MAGPLRSRTLIVVVSDNGTPQAAGGPAGHAKDTVYQGGVCTPLLISPPGVRLAPSTPPRCPAVVSACDLFSTILAAAATEDAAGVDSISFRPLLSNPLAEGARQMAIAQSFDPFGSYVPSPAQDPGKVNHERGISDGRMKYVRRWEKFSGTYIEEVFDLTTDPGETQNLVPVFGSLPPDLQTAIVALQQELLNVTGF